MIINEAGKQTSRKMMKIQSSPNWEVMGGDAVVVTVFSDSNKKYLSTDLMKDEPVKEHYLSPEIELLDYNPIHRL